MTGVDHVFVSMVLWFAVASPGSVAFREKVHQMEGCMSKSNV